MLYGVAVIGFVGALGVTTVVSAKENDRPSAEPIAFAQQVSDLMTNELVAALFTEFTRQLQTMWNMASRRSAGPLAGPLSGWCVEDGRQMQRCDVWVDPGGPRLGGHQAFAGIKGH